MKKVVSLWLVLTLVLSLVGCGSGGEKAPETVSEAAVTVAETEAPTEETTEPTLSAEEVLYNSLTDRQKMAVDLGIVEIDLLEDLARICTGTEAAQLLQNARVLKRGSESVVLSQVKDSVHADIEVTRFWMAQMMHASEMEVYATPTSEDLLENILYLTWDCYGELSDEAMVYMTHQPQWIVSENWGVISHTNMNAKGKFDRWSDQDAVIAHGYMTGLTDFLECSWEVEDKPEDWVKFVDYGSPESAGWALLSYDKTNGEKLFAWNENMELRPREKVTVADAVEMTMRYYNSISEGPEMLAYADVPTYDKSIITDDLLTKQTTLPEASCQNLPKAWKGVTMEDLLYYNDDGDAKTDQRIHENEIQLIKDAGFNYVRILFDFEYYMSEIPDQYYIFSDYPDEGMMNETHLKELDRIIAWCMERDIHVNLTCAGVVGWSKLGIPDSIFAKAKNAAPLAEQWQVLARRYAGIPNTYLSFTLYENPPIWQDAKFADFFGSVVEAIRGEDSDRCIIADLSLKATGESMAQLGVALSSRAALPGELEIDPQAVTAVTDKKIAATAWPCESGRTVYDGAVTMAFDDGWIQSTPDSVAAVAQQYGVGFMVSQWAPYMSYGNSTRRERYTDEMMQAFLKDMTQTMEERGYGWCYGNWFGFVGFGAAYPAVRSTTYTKLNEAPLYVDNETFGWFREINGAA